MLKKPAVFAEAGRFELPESFRPRHFSKVVPSTTQTRFQVFLRLGV